MIIANIDRFEKRLKKILKEEGLIREMRTSVFLRIKNLIREEKKISPTAKKYERKKLQKLIELQTN